VLERTRLKLITQQSEQRVKSNSELIPDQSGRCHYGSGFEVSIQLSDSPVAEQLQPFEKRLLTSIFHCLVGVHGIRKTIRNASAPELPAGLPFCPFVS